MRLKSVTVRNTTHSDPRHAAMRTRRLSRAGFQTASDVLELQLTELAAELDVSPSDALEIREAVEVYP